MEKTGLSMDDTEGIRFGRYRLLDLIGEGGMGRVYRARDTLTNRVVAIKVLPVESGSNPMFRERFQREANAVAGLREPHVVPIHDFGEIDGQLYLDMRLIDGIDVKELIAERGALPAAQAVSIIEQVAAALDAAHAAGLVHRDVKPSNILLGDRDFAYLIDFGIARASGESGLTSTGMAIGTFAYMAPERFSTGDADRRSDVYALACVFYEFLTGKQPFGGDSFEQQIAAHLTAEIPLPSRSGSAVSAAWDAVISRGMAKNPADRYGSAGELAAAARAALHARTDPTVSAVVAQSSRTADTQVAPTSGIAATKSPAVKQSSRKRLRVTTLAVVVAIAIVGTSWALLSRRDSPAPSTSAPTTTAASTSSATAHPVPTDSGSGSYDATIENAGFGLQDGTDAVDLTATVSFNLLDNSGMLLATQSQNEYVVNPRQRTIIGTLIYNAPYAAQVARIETSLSLNPRITKKEPLKYSDVVLSVSDSTVQVQGSQIYAQATITNPTDVQLGGGARVGIACFNERGQIVGGGRDYPAIVPAKGRVLINDPVTVSERPVRCDMTAYPTQPI